MPEREALPVDRQGLTHKVTIGGSSGFITANTYEDGRLAEVFIHGFGKLGSTMQGWADTFAIMLSMSLQHGMDVSNFVRKFTGKRFDPSGETDNDEIPWCWSVPDYVLRWLARYHGDEDLMRLIADTDRALTEQKQPNA